MFACVCVFALLNVKLIYVLFILICFFLNSNLILDSGWINQCFFFAQTQKCNDTNQMKLSYVLFVIMKTWKNAIIIMTMMITIIILIIVTCLKFKLFFGSYYCWLVTLKFGRKNCPFSYLIKDGCQKIWSQQ